MAYTEKQWNSFQASLPAEDRTSYLDYIKEVDPAAYNKLINKVLENLKIAEANSGAPISQIVDEQTKRAAMKVNDKVQKVALTAKAEEARAALAKLTSGSQLTDADKEALNIKATTPAPTTTSAPAKKTPTNAELQTIVSKLAKGQQLTDEEAAAINAPTPAPTTTLAPVNKTFTPAELQTIVAKLTNDDPLTSEEATAIGLIVTTAKPIVTTAGPVITTAGPVLTTAVPVVTTASPVVTTAGPVLTTAGPALTTASPVLTTANPVITTAGPTVTTGSPVLTTVSPILTTAGPGTVTTAAPGVPTYKATDGTVFTDQAAFVAYEKILTDAAVAKNATSAAAAADRQSAYDLLYAQFASYGLGSLVEPLRGLIQSGASPAEFSIKLRESEPYKKRFSANQQRVSKGLKAISEAEYLGLEDQYQNILRNAGLPESYWKRGDLGVQEGFTNFIANDVSAVELEDRVSTAQQRVLYANPEVSIALKTFYPDISNGDLLAYALDPTKGLEQIKRRITAAEIGSSAVQLGLATNVTDAEYLARYGVNKAQAQQGYRTAAEILPVASKLGDIYSKQGLGPYTQQTAEQEIFNVPGAAEAAAKRRKLSELEQASFSGKAGMGALARDRAGAF